MAKMHFDMKVFFICILMIANVSYQNAVYILLTNIISSAFKRNL